MTNLTNLSEATITKKIYLVREKKVMLDRDLAELYGVDNRVLGQQVKRNSDKFPSDFMFKLTQKETDDLRSQFVTANISPKSRVLPTVFTEHGVLMLANLRDVVP
ncbi:MAG: ORF6N domain-containing protein [Cytophagales bacterium]|nr:ORF6N domain-containing protein [Cytophagales bacterium]